MVDTYNCQFLSIDCSLSLRALASWTTRAMGTTAENSAAAAAEVATSTCASTSTSAAVAEQVPGSKLEYWIDQFI